MKKYITPQMEVLRFHLPRLLEDSRSEGTIPLHHSAPPIEAQQGLARESEEADTWYEEEIFPPSPQS